MLFVKTILNIKELAQLGKTPFIQNEKPNPFDEAVSLIWYLENGFELQVICIQICKKPFFSAKVIKNAIINRVFWPEIIMMETICYHRNLKVADDLELQF
jgi:hypothetical protein